MKKELEDKIIAEFGEKEGRAIIEDSDAISEHCARHNIDHHSVDVNGYCNMGCC